MKRLLHGTMWLRNSPTGEQIQTGRTTDEIQRDPIAPYMAHHCSVLVLPCRNFCAENFLIFFYEIKLLLTYLLFDTLA